METKKGYVLLTQRPRPDHPNEKRPLLLREDLIGIVVVGDYKYEPDNKAPVQLLPNARVLSGEATFVSTLTGVQFVVHESMQEVHRRIEAARNGAAPGFTEEQPANVQPQLVATA